MKVDHSSVARRVISIERDALSKLAENLPEDFDAVVEAILGLKGKVIVSGIGKSGHIGRKIAATLASTGTPSYFVHSTEARHGDLGMISSDDLCILISNSGETEELKDLLAYTRRYSIPLVGISSQAKSTLMRAADYRLLLVAAPEACPIGMAPTTSTTMTIALGDALAVALMEQRGFKAEDFGVLHPGGRLGAQLSTVGQLMHGPEKVPIVTKDTDMSDALLEMTAKGFGVTGVLDSGRLVGVISDGDLRRNMEGLMMRTAGDVASYNPVTVKADTMAVQALALLNARKVNVLFVVDDERRPVGIVHIHDFLRSGVA